jgi:hypothetical protein
MQSSMEAATDVISFFHDYLTNGNTTDYILKHLEVSCLGNSQTLREQQEVYY